MNKTSYEGRTAVVTDASTDIGRAFAETLAKRGAHLILVTRSPHDLQAFAAWLSKVNAVHVEVLRADLSCEGAAQHVCAAVQQLGQPVDLLITNAGCGIQAPFDMVSAERDYEQVLLHIGAAVDLTRGFLPAMLERGRGAIVTVTSPPAFFTVPTAAAFGVPQAFLFSLSCALWAACRARGVRVLVLSLGAPRIGAVGADGERASRAFGSHSTSTVLAEKALQALERGRSSVVPGIFSAPLVHGLWKMLPMDRIALLSKRGRWVSSHLYPEAHGPAVETQAGSGAPGVDAHQTSLLQETVRSPGHGVAARSDR